MTMAQHPFSILLSALLLATLASCGSQPKVHCTIARASFAVRYTLQSGSGPCSELTGESLGAQAYVPNFYAKPGDGDNGAIAIQSVEMGTLLANGEAANPPVTDPDITHTLYGFGKFTSLTPDENQICSVPTLTEANLNLAEVPAQPGDMDAGVAPTDAQPAAAISYQWSNVRVRVSAAQTGLEWTGDVTYTRDGCSANFHAAAVSPAVSCDSGNGTADPTLCDAQPNAAAGRYTGSGINPDLAVVCEPTSLLCVPSTDQPF